MGDMGDIFNDMRADRRARVEKRVEEHRPFIEQLKARAIGIGYLSGGFRFTFAGASGYKKVFDYWPQRGKWHELKPKHVCVIVVEDDGEGGDVISLFQGGDMSVLAVEGAMHRAARMMGDDR